MATACRLAKMAAAMSTPVSVIEGGVKIDIEGGGPAPAASPGAAKPSDVKQVETALKCFGK